MQKKVSKRIKKISVGFIVAAVIIFLILLLGNVQDPKIRVARSGAESLEYIFYDMFFKTSTGKVTDQKVGKNITVADNYDPNILIVDIDENSLAKLGNYNTWDRNIHAEVVRTLSEGGASAIGFDILFKNADFGKQKAEQSLTMLKHLDRNKQWDSLYNSIRANYNFDSMMVHSINESGKVIACYDMGDRSTYFHETVWRPLSTPQRADEIGYTSTFELNQVDKPADIEEKDLLDNIFPELAQASKFIGSVNAYPDDDGVNRRVAMLYRFPTERIDTNVFKKLDEHGEPINFYKLDTITDKDVKIYTTMSLMTVLHLYHQKPENVKIKMGKYIDVGKPFGVYRDIDGSLHTTFPHFSYPMFASLKAKLKQSNAKIRKSEIYRHKQEFIDVSSKIVALKDDDGEITLDLFEGQSITGKLVEVLRHFDENNFKDLNGLEIKDIEEGITLQRDSTEQEHYIVTDTEEDEEAIITPYIISTLKYFADTLENLIPNKRAHLSLDVDIRYDVQSKQWKSNLVILSADVLKDILKMPEDTISKLKPGEEIRFGNVKRIPIDNHGRYLVNYQGRYNTEEAKRSFQHISYYDVLKHRIDEGFFQGKTFILGSAAPAMFDFVSGPHEEHYPGVLVHATILQNILNNKFLTFMREYYQQIVVILLGLICLLIGLYVRSFISISICVLLMVVYTIIAYNFFLRGIYIGVSKQLLAILLTNIGALIVQFYYESKEKSFLNNAFKQYISPELIDEMVNNEIMPTLGGSKSNITAYFTDIASFSTFSEKIGDPSKLVDLLNEYLTAMTDTLLSNKGTLDKYEGDAIIAFFGAPMPLENHAQSACDAAVDMQNKLMGLRKKWASEGDKWPQIVHDMHMRIGINSGDIVTGNMGSSMRKNYTMMGDAVNLASRLESAAKQYGAYIQISEDTQQNLEKDHFIYRSLDTIRVVGKSQPVKTFELLERRGCNNEEKYRKLVELWEQAREAYLAMEWDKAIALFTACLEFEPHLPEHDPGSKTCPSLVYIKRCEDYKIIPPVAPGEVWDGVFTATSK
ncbi:MAG: CHASE2 domain-containing protein [Fibrobacter sp.]|nr:CHASE2 domain-containing protein [Fibrobacter sp.]